MKHRIGKKSFYLFMYLEIALRIYKLLTNLEFLEYYTFKIVLYFNFE